MKAYFVYVKRVPRTMYHDLSDLAVFLQNHPDEWLRSMKRYKALIDCDPDHRVVLTPGILPVLEDGQTYKIVLTYFASPVGNFEGAIIYFVRRSDDNI